MSRLDSGIRRLEAQRSCIDTAVSMIGARAGVVLELGLGNGRTYDHLRERLPDKEIFVFDRQVAAHPDSIPDCDHLIIGDLNQTLVDVQSRFRDSVVLVHSDVGTGDEVNNTTLLQCLGPALAPMLASESIVVSDQQITIPGAQIIELPEGVPHGRYYMLQMGH